MLRVMSQAAWLPCQAATRWQGQRQSKWKRTPPKRGKEQKAEHGGGSPAKRVRVMSKSSRDAPGRSMAMAVEPQALSQQARSELCAKLPKWQQQSSEDLEAVIAFCQDGHGLGEAS